MKKLIAKDLLKIKAVFFRPEEPFTWASGIKSPIYTDNRLTLTAPEARNQVEEGLAELVKKHYPDCEVLMGTSTAGIPHAAIAAHFIQPFFFFVLVYSIAPAIRSSSMNPIPSRILLLFIQ